MQRIKTHLTLQYQPRDHSIHISLVITVYTWLLLQYFFHQVVALPGDMTFVFR